MSDFSLTIKKCSPIAFVHGYEVYGNGQLGPLSQAICNAIERLLEINGEIRAILLGGWHLKEAGACTIADVMARYLINAGVSPKRIITKLNFESLDTDMPPRDTWEELIALRKILAKMGIDRNAPLQSIAWDFHIPRLKKMYKTFEITNVETIPVTPKPYKGLWRRKLTERVARIVRFIDPHGNGIICQTTRLGRTFDESLKPIIS